MTFSPVKMYLQKLLLNKNVFKNETEFFSQPDEHL